MLRAVRDDRGLASISVLVDVTHPLRVGDDLPAHHERRSHRGPEEYVPQRPGPLGIVPLLPVHVDHDIAPDEPGYDALKRVRETLGVHDVVGLAGGMDAGQDAVDQLPEKLVFDRGKKDAVDALVNRSSIDEEIAAAIDGEVVATSHQPLSDVQRDLLAAGVAVRDAAGADEGNPHPASVGNGRGLLLSPALEDISANPSGLNQQ